MAYYHYTSRQRAQDIMCSGIIFPGPSGKIFLTTELYVTGASAVNALAITQKVIEAAIEIPSAPVPAGISSPATRVSPIVAPTGMPIRRGGAAEQFCPGPLSVTEDKWIALREP